LLFESWRPRRQRLALLGGARAQHDCNQNNNISRRLLTTIRRVPDEQTLVLQCRPRGLSTTETVDAPKPGESTSGGAPRTSVTSSAMSSSSGAVSIASFLTIQRIGTIEPMTLVAWRLPLLPGRRPQDRRRLVRDRLPPCLGDLQHRDDRAAAFL
jgi:hypothetical protein